MDDTIERSWDQKVDEPDVWYHIFKDYYLPLGEKRSLRNAFEFYIRVETPKQYKDLDPENITRIPSHWNAIALQWEWGKRAMDYDQEKVMDFAAATVNQVLTYLQSNAMLAAEGLVRALANDRTRVQASNSILNRIGVPETSNISLSGGVSFTSDDMAAAVDKVNAWKTQKLSGSPAEQTSATS